SAHITSRTPSISLHDALPILYPSTYEMPLNLTEYLYKKELTLTGIFISPYAFPRAELIIEDLDLDPFLKCVFDLDDAQLAFNEHLAGTHPKVIIRCNSDLAEEA